MCVLEKPDHTLDKAALRPLKPNKLVCEIDSEREGDTFLPNLNFSDYKIDKTVAIKYDPTLSNKMLMHVKSVLSVFLSLLQVFFHKIHQFLALPLTLKSNSPIRVSFGSHTYMVLNV